MTHLCDIPHSYVWHDLFVCVICICVFVCVFVCVCMCVCMCVCLYVCVCMCDVPYSNRAIHLPYCGSQWFYVPWLTRVTWLIHMCHASRSYVWHASSIQGHQSSFIVGLGAFIYMCNDPHVWHDPFSFIYVTRLVHMCDMPHPYRAIKDPLSWVLGHLYVPWPTCVTCLIHICHTTRPYVWHVPSI